MDENKRVKGIIREFLAFLTIIFMWPTTKANIMDVFTNGKYTFTQRQEKNIEAFTKELEEEDLDGMYKYVLKAEKAYNKSEKKSEKEKETEILENEFFALNEVACKITLAKMNGRKIDLTELLPWDLEKYTISMDLENPEVNSLKDALESLEQLSTEEAIYTGMRDAYNNLSSVYEAELSELRYETTIGEEIRKATDEFRDGLYVNEKVKNFYYDYMENDESIDMEQQDMEQQDMEQ